MLRKRHYRKALVDWIDTATPSPLAWPSASTDSWGTTWFIYGISLQGAIRYDSIWFTSGKSPLFASPSHHCGAFVHDRWGAAGNASHRNFIYNSNNSNVLTLTCEYCAFSSVLIQRCCIVESIAWVPEGLHRNTQWTEYSLGWLPFKPLAARVGVSYSSIVQSQEQNRRMCRREIDSKMVV